MTEAQDKHSTKNVQKKEKVCTQKGYGRPYRQSKGKKLDKVFDCFFCQSAGAVRIKMNSEDGLAFAHCSTCKATGGGFRMCHLTEAVDVYHAWLDDVEETNNELNKTG